VKNNGRFLSNHAIAHPHGSTNFDDVYLTHRFILYGGTEVHPNLVEVITVRVELPLS
jgi:hypothetical protein